METEVIIGLFGIAALILIGALIRFRSKLEGKISIPNVIDLWFKGENPPVSEAGLIQHKNLQDVEKLPKLALKLFRRGSRDELKDEISVDVNENGEFNFGFVLLNLEEGTTASNIRITVDIYWRGENIEFAPHFKTYHMSDVCTSECGSITANQPSVFLYRDQEKTIFHSHPEKWPGFKGIISGKPRGSFLIIYRVSSADPISTSQGELNIYLPVEL
jgi:hypothetical protein